MSCVADWRDGGLGGYEYIPAEEEKRRGCDVSVCQCWHKREVRGGSLVEGVKVALFLA